MPGCAPRIPYAVSKAACDVLGGQYADAHDMSVIRTRAFNQAGPGQSDDYVVGTITRQVAEAEIAGRDAAVLKLGNVDARRDFTDVRDVARAYASLSGRPAGVYNICRGSSVSVAEIIDLVRASARVEVRYEVDPSRVRSHEVMDIRGSAALLRAETGWEPEIPLERTVAVRAGRVAHPARRRLGGEAELDRAERLELEPHHVAVAHGRGRGEHAGDDPLARAQAPRPRRRAAGPRRPPSPPGGRRCARRARVASPRRSRAPAPRPGVRGLHARPERHRAVEDVPGEDPLATSQERSGGSATSSAGSSATIVRASSPSSTATSGSATTGPAVERERRAVRRAAPALDRKPASGASMPSFSWTAGTLKPTFQPIGWAPRLEHRRGGAEHRPRGRGHGGLAHGRMTIFRASRRS